ncbi:MAG: bifunctional UDP-N-acetylglucosamine diphosphorylase/glucosamine-1-phosphate N-acetyltransferase GlmU, partial [Bacillati bacterium ANGP1]
MEQVHAVVLAAGKGKRMHSDLPKVLHLLCGQPLILYVFDALHHAGIPSSIVVVGQGDDRVCEVVGPQARYVEQPEPRGTGHAVMTALPLLPQDGTPVLVLYGDTPLLTAETIHALLALHRTSGSAATLLSAQVPDPTGYGRVIRDHDGRVRKIVEEVDCSDE